LRHRVHDSYSKKSYLPIDTIRVIENLLFQVGNKYERAPKKCGLSKKFFNNLGEGFFALGLEVLSSKLFKEFFRKEVKETYAKIKRTWIC
jgi:hypothetical protein